MKDSFKLSTGLDGRDPTFMTRRNSIHGLKHSVSVMERFSKSFKHVNKIFLFYTLLIFFNHFSFGLSVNIIGATLVDIGFVYEVPLTTVSQMVVVNNIGYTAGALAGYLYKWLNRQIMLVIFTLFISLTTFVVPHYGFVWLIFVAITINGVGCGAWDAANSVWLVDMWPVGSTAVLQAAQFMYGAGITLAPILAQNYVFGDMNTTTTGEVLTPDLRKEYLTFPYIVSGALQTIAPVFFLILYFTRKYVEIPEASALSEIPSMSSKIDLNNNDHLERGKSMDTISVYSVDEKSAYDRENVPWRKTKLVLCGICLAAYFSAENGYFYYCTAMLQIIEIKLSAAEATSVTSVLALCYTIGPLVTAVVSLKLKPDHIISYHFVFLVTGISIIYFFQTNLTMLYIGSGILGYGFSAMVPAINAFTERHFKFSDTVASMYTFVCGGTSLIIPITLGQYFDDNPQLLMYMVAGYIFISLTLFLLVRLWITISHK